MLDKILHEVLTILKTGEYSSIGFVRLSILDLSENSNQPITDMIQYRNFFNGEIYNFIEQKNFSK